MDDAYHALIWSVIIQHPSVRVGIVPDGLDTEVYIPLQPRTSRKKQDAGEVQEEPQPMALEILPEAHVLPLSLLLEQYGSKLRVAVDPETSFAAITGSHIRASRIFCFCALYELNVTTANQAEPNGLCCSATYHS